jgi:polyisoprenoid-binding protein YceI
MMRKVAWLGALMALTSALALAQTFSVKGASGAGAAGPADSDQIDAFFSFSVAQISYGDRSWQGGWFTLTTRQDNQVISVAMYRLTAFTVDTNARTASFSGQAVLVVRTRTGFERIRGTVQVSVADNRSRDGNGDPDTLEVVFFDEDGNEVFSYSGTVKRGDIAVFERSARR